jgi:7-cyano-7-deazaguanine tRNA-ribosyltransferase
MLEIDSVDSSGWRNRAARGIILLPGKTERTISELGSWNGRKLNTEDEKALLNCECPPCVKLSIDGLKAKATEGFCNRATHNLWVLLQENKWIQEKIADGSYSELYKERVQNSSYRILLDELVEKKSRIISPREIIQSTLDYIKNKKT